MFAVTSAVVAPMLNSMSFIVRKLSQVFGNVVLQVVVTGRSSLTHPPTLSGSVASGSDVLAYVKIGSFAETPITPVVVDDWADNVSPALVTPVPPTLCITVCI